MRFNFETSHPLLSNHGTRSAGPASRPRASSPVGNSCSAEAALSLRCECSENPSDSRHGPSPPKCPGTWADATIYGLEVLQNLYDTTEAEMQEHIHRNTHNTDIYIYICSRTPPFDQKDGKYVEKNNECFPDACLSYFPRSIKGKKLDILYL